MNYTINSLDELNIQEIAENSSIYIKNMKNIEKKPEKLFFSTCVYDLVINKNSEVFIEDLKFRKDIYFEKVICIEKDEQLIKKIFRSGQRISEGTDNYLLPVGTVVVLKDESVIYIAGRALQNEYVKDKQMYTDYVGYFYPSGLESEEKCIFNHENVVGILHVGYQDDVIDELSYGIMKVLCESKYEKYTLNDEDDNDDITNI